MHRSIGALTVLAVLSCAACDQRSAFSHDEEARFADALATMHADQQSVGSALIVDDGAHRYEGAAGFAERATGRERTAQTPFRIASVTKTFTGALILALHEEGALSVDDPLSRYLPAFPNGENMTLRMLLNHTSGIANYTKIAAYNEAFAADTTRIFTPEELVAYAASAPSDFPPGTDWNYSNTGYIILGMIAESIVHRSLPEELRARWFDRLGMSHTVPLTSPPAEMVVGYQVALDGTATEVPASSALRAYAADGGWVSTLENLVIWARALFGGHLHSPATLALARVPAGGALLDGVARAYGFDSGGYDLGLIQAHDRALGMLYAGAGNGDGTRDFVGYLPDTDIAFIVSVNVGDGAVPIVEDLSAVQPLLVAIRAHVAAH